MRQTDQTPHAENQGPRPRPNVPHERSATGRLRLGADRTISAARSVGNASVTQAAARDQRGRMRDDLS